MLAGETSSATAGIRDGGYARGRDLLEHRNRYAMWIAIRILAAVVAFIARHIQRLLFSPTPVGAFEGTLYFQKLEKDKKGKVTGFRVGVHLRVPVILRLQAEHASDRLFKALGLAKEFQTGDNEFDREIYVACDHPALFHLLLEDERARMKIREVLGAGFHRISTDGEALWIERTVDREPTVTELKLLVELRNVLAELESRLRHYSDPFVAKAVAVEAVTWSVFAYAAGALLELTFNRVDYHVDSWQLLGPGLLAATILFGLLFGLVVALLRGSSRGHRILVEGAVLLVISVPVASVQTVSDLNRYLDSSETVVISREIERAEVRRGRKSTAYYLVLAPVMGPSQVDLPSRIRVTRDVYSQATPGLALDLHLGRGWLGFPWYRRIVVRARAEIKEP